jgi:hypothetical protein
MRFDIDHLGRRVPAVETNEVLNRLAQKILVHLEWRLADKIVPDSFRQLPDATFQIGVCDITHDLRVRDTRHHPARLI